MNKLILLLGIVVISLSCNTNPGNFDEQKNLNNAIWISDGIEQPTSDSLFYLDNYSPLFRKEFNPKNEIESATLFITAAGYYKASINGIRIGKNVLSPA